MGSLQCFVEYWYCSQSIQHYLFFSFHLGTNGTSFYGGRRSTVIVNIIQQIFNSSNGRKFSTPWDTSLFEGYNSTETFGHVDLVNLFGDCATFSKSGTQSTTFIRIKFANIKRYFEKWFEVGIAPTQNHFLYCVPDGKNDDSERYSTISFSLCCLNP